MVYAREKIIFPCGLELEDEAVFNRWFFNRSNGVTDDIDSGNCPLHGKKCKR